MNTGVNGVILSQSSGVLPQVLSKLALLLWSLLTVFTLDWFLLYSARHSSHTEPWFSDGTERRPVVIRASRT